MRPTDHAGSDPSKTTGPLSAASEPSSRRQRESGFSFGQSPENAIAPRCLTTKSRTFVGIDIGKTSLDVFARGARFRVDNTRAGHMLLLTRVRQERRRLQFICEGGSYGRRLVEFLHAKKCKLTVVSPYKARQFAKTIGWSAKTDKIDAELLALFGATFRPMPSKRMSRELEGLREILRRRGQIVKIIKSQKLQRQFITSRPLIAQTTAAVDFLGAQLKTLDATALQLTDESEALRSKRDVLCSVDGVGKKTAVQLLAELPELGTINRRKIAALAGLAPFDDDSGTSEGRREIRAGRKYARSALYMATFNAIKVNEIIRSHFLRLKQRGKPHRVAMVAVMRKLLVHLNSMAAGLAEREPQRPSPAPVTTEGA